MNYGETTETADLTVYIVQTTFPRPEQEPSERKFGQYVSWAYTPKDDPGHRKGFFSDERYKALLHNEHRANYATIDIHRYNDSMVFLTAEAALACAAALEEHAVLSSPYEHNMDWALEQRGIPVRARVVERRKAVIGRVVLP
jgi:hypothetical protein